jgi:hypothetical protein
LINRPGFGQMKPNRYALGQFSVFLKAGSVNRRL